MKLTNKKKQTILWVGGGILFLTLFITTAIVINANRRGNPVSNLTPNPLPVPAPDPTSLTTQKNQAITEIETAIVAKSISNATLVQKLITENKLSSDQTNWKAYLEDSSLTTVEQITERIKDLQTILASLENQTPVPTPIPQPDPPPRTPPPQPLPDIRPTNQWEGILWDIRKFLDTELNPIINECQEIKRRNLGEEDLYLRLADGSYQTPDIKKGEEVNIKYFDELKSPHAKIDKRRYEELSQETLKKIKSLRDSIITEKGEPLAGIDLAGVGIDKLKELPSYGTIGLKEGSNYYEDWFGGKLMKKYEDWVQLSAAGDGNCFLHAWSVYLIGRSDLELTTKLRVAMCLEVMTNFEGRYFNPEIQDCPAQVFKKELFDKKIVQNFAWLSNFEDRLMGYILKRPLVVINNNRGWFEPAWFLPEDHGITAKYPETWVIYNSGGHFQPLIKKN